MMLRPGHRPGFFVAVVWDVGLMAQIDTLLAWAFLDGNIKINKIGGFLLSVLGFGTRLRC